MNNELIHYGIPGMKWGVRRTPSQLGYNKGDSSVTKRVKKDYNSMSDQEFKNKYRTSKKTYAKRVTKYGDPYMNSPLAKAGKKIADRDRAKAESKLNKLGRKTDKKLSAIQKDIDSFKGHENGIYAKNGKMLLSKADVQQSVKGLSDLKAKHAKKVTDMTKQLSETYTVTYDVVSKSYKLRYKH